MLRPKNIARFDKRGDIVSATITTNTGQEVRTYDYENPDYEDVAAIEIKASGAEIMEGDQVVNSEKRAFAIRKLDRTVTTLMIWRMDGEDYHIRSVHQYGDDRTMIVLECEARDND